MSKEQIKNEDLKPQIIQEILKKKEAFLRKEGTVTNKLTAALEGIEKAKADLEWFDNEFKKMRSDNQTELEDLMREHALKSEAQTKLIAQLDEEIKLKEESNKTEINKLKEAHEQAKTEQERKNEKELYELQKSHRENLDALTEKFKAQVYEMELFEIRNAADSNGYVMVNKSDYQKDKGQLEKLTEGYEKEIEAIKSKALSEARDEAMRDLKEEIEEARKDKNEAIQAKSDLAYANKEIDSLKAQLNEAKDTIKELNEKHSQVLMSFASSGGNSGGHSSGNMR